MSLVDSPVDGIPAFLAGLTCEGFRRSPSSPDENHVTAFLPEEMGLFEKETGDRALLHDGLTSSAEEVQATHSAACPPREMLKGLGWAVAVHAALLLAVLMFPMTTSFHAAESQFITVTLEGPGDGFGGGPSGAGGGSEGAGTSPAAPSCPPAVAAPPPDRAAGPLQVLEIPKAPRPERAEPTKTVSLPPEKPVVKEKPPRRSTPKPAKELAASSVKPKEAETADTGTHEAISSPACQPGPAASGAGATGAAPEGPAAGGGPGEGSGRGTGGGDGPGTGRGGPGGGSGGTAGEFTAGQVDHPPVVLHKVDPRFPETARRMGVSGKIVVRFLVKPDGRVSRPSVLEVQPSGLFEECVLAALNQWEFKPGTYRGKAVPTWVVQTIHFKLTR